jgi:hypothetical protein
MKDYYHTIRWMNEALDRFEEEKKMGLQPSANELDILDYLAFANGKVKYSIYIEYFEFHNIFTNVYLSKEI